MSFLAAGNNAFWLLGMLT